MRKERYSITGRFIDDLRYVDALMRLAERTNSPGVLTSISSTADRYLSNGPGRKEFMGATMPEALLHQNCIKLKRVIIANPNAPLILLRRNWKIAHQLISVKMDGYRELEHRLRMLRGNYRTAERSPVQK